MTEGILERLDRIEQHLQSITAATNARPLGTAHYEVESRWLLGTKWKNRSGFRFPTSKDAAAFIARMRRPALLMSGNPLPPPLKRWRIIRVDDDGSREVME